MSSETDRANVSTTSWGSRPLQEYPAKKLQVALQACMNFEESSVQKGDTDSNSHASCWDLLLLARRELLLPALLHTPELGRHLLFAASLQQETAKGVYYSEDSQHAVPGHGCGRRVASALLKLLFYCCYHVRVGMDSRRTSNLCLPVFPFSC